MVEEQKLDGVVKLPSGVFSRTPGQPQILPFTKTNSGGTDSVWFYDVAADGFRWMTSAQSRDNFNDLPDVLARWELRSSSELERGRTEKSFCVPKR